MIVIVGPTGIGKTKLSIALAKRYNTEIISGDSVQVYKELNIGSAKVTEQEKEDITHHLIDLYEPTEDFSVAIYQKLVRNKIQDFQSRNLIPLIVGGTGLYFVQILNAQGIVVDVKKIILQWNHHVSYETVNSSNSNSDIIVIVISQTELTVIVVV